MSAAVTKAASAANLKTAAGNVARDMAVDPKNLTYDQRIAYNKALATEILKYPQSFTDETLAIAQKASGANYQELEDAGFSWTDFGNGALDSAGEIVASAGNLAHTAVIVAVIAALAFYILPGAVAKAAASSKPAAA